MSWKKDIQVRKHCHITSEHRASAHQICNANFLLTKKIPVTFHNLRGYDGYLIMQEIVHFNQKINDIPNDLEKIYGFHATKKLLMSEF